MSLRGAVRTSACHFKANQCLLRAATETTLANKWRYPLPQSLLVLGFARQATAKRVRTWRGSFQALLPDIAKLLLQANMQLLNGRATEVWFYVLSVAQCCPSLFCCLACPQLFPFDALCPKRTSLQSKPNRSFNSQAASSAVCGIRAFSLSSSSPGSSASASVQVFTTWHKEGDHLTRSVKIGSVPALQIAKERHACHEQGCVKEVRC